MARCLRRVRKKARRDDDVMGKHRWLHDLRPGDRMWFEGSIETIETITPVGGGGFLIEFVGRNVGVCQDGEWAVPDERDE